MGIVVIGCIVGFAVGMVGIFIAGATMDHKIPAYLLIIIVVLSSLLTGWLIRLFNGIHR